MVFSWECSFESFARKRQKPKRRSLGKQKVSSMYLKVFTTPVFLCFGRPACRVSLHPWYDARTRVHPRFFDQVGHQTNNASSGNKHFFIKSCHRQTYQNYEQSRQKLGTILENKVQCTPDLVTSYLVTNPDLVTILQKTIFLVHKNISFSDNLVFSAPSI